MTDREYFKSRCNELRKNLSHKYLNLEDLAKKVKDENNLGKIVMGNIFCRLCSYDPGRGVGLIRSYCFLNHRIDEMVTYESVNQAKTEGFKDGLENFKELVKPHPVISSGENVIIKPFEI